MITARDGSEALETLQKKEYGFVVTVNDRIMPIVKSAMGAPAFPDPQKKDVGISELAYNAIEHRNPGITYDEKSKYQKEGLFEEEIERRLSLPENDGKRKVLNLRIRTGH